MDMGYETSDVFVLELLKVKRVQQCVRHRGSEELVYLVRRGSLR